MQMIEETRNMLYAVWPHGCFSRLVPLPPLAVTPTQVGSLKTPTQVWVSLISDASWAENRRCILQRSSASTSAGAGAAASTETAAAAGGGDCGVGFVRQVALLGARDGPAPSHVRESADLGGGGGRVSSPQRRPRGGGVPRFYAVPPPPQLAGQYPRSPKVL